MILVDAGPLVALFNPRDDWHVLARQRLLGLSEKLITTVPVLTEALYLLGSSGRGSAGLREFVVRGGLDVWWLSERSLQRAFRLMDDYADQPMDFADASLVTAAETLRTTRVFTIDRRDFSAYRARFGRTARAFTLV